MHLPQGLFLSLEGGEGTGKSTQLKEVRKALVSQGYDVLMTREPGGTPHAEAIRDLMLSQEHKGWDGWSEALMMIAARVEHARHVIVPALAEGRVVLCDRYVDSTYVYQGISRGLGVEAMQALHHPAMRLPMPSRTFVLDAPLDYTRERLAKRKQAATRFDAEKDAFHEKIRQGFLTLAQQWPERLHVIDARQPIRVVTAALLAGIQEVINKTRHT